jgi:hypothetical protein
LDIADRAANKESIEIVDDLGSQFSDGVTECKSTAVEQEYDLIAGDDCSESLEELEDRGKFVLIFIA